MEAGVALVLGLAFAAAILGPHVAGGGRYLDDWWLGAYIRFPRELGFASAYDYLDFYSGARPGAVLYWLTTYDLFGFHDAWHRGASVFLAGGLAAVFYELMRELRLGRIDAGAIALLTIALPVADSIRFWMTPAVSQLCLAACAAGFLLGLRALRAEGRSSVALHALSLALFALSLALAETMLPAIGLSLLLYRTRTGWRQAAARWAADLVVVGVGVIHYALNTRTRLLDVAPGVSALDHARTLLDQLVTLFTSTLAPFAGGRGPVLAVVAAVLILAAVQAARRADARRWLCAAALAAIFAAASYVIYVPADPSYQPLSTGVGNRVNIGALLALSVLAFAVVRLAGGLVPGRWPRAAVTMALFAVLLTTALGRLQDDRELWAAAASEQDRVLTALHRALPRPPAGSSLLVLGAPGVVTRFGRIGHERVNQPVPVFSTWWSSTSPRSSATTGRISPPTRSGRSSRRSSSAARTTSTSSASTACATRWPTGGCTRSTSRRRARSASTTKPSASAPPATARRSAMTCRSSARPGRTARAGRFALATALVALALAGCGERAADDDGPREAAAAFLQRLATGDVRGLCRSMSAAAVAELARDFGGSSCPETAKAAARYVATARGLRSAIEEATILPTLDVPLSPAPQRPGATTTALRLVIDDPVLGTRQALDVRLVLAAGRWRVDSGVNALFTLARAREPRAAG